jgi:hypothetical protein
MVHSTHMASPTGDNEGRRRMRSVLLAGLASLLAIAGIIYGVVRRRWAIMVGCAVALVLVIALWAYFWFNPY